MKPRPKSQINGKYSGINKNNGAFTFSKHSDRVSLNSYHKINGRMKRSESHS